jgi:hypothetical protein
MYIAVSVTKPSGGSPGAPAPKEPNVVLVKVSDILVWPMRDSKGVRLVGDYVLKPNATQIEIYMTSSKSKASGESEGDEDAVALKYKFEGEHPGNELEISEFIQNSLGEDWILIYGSCSDNFRKVLGTKCAPMKLKPSLQDDSEARKQMLVFEQLVSSKFVPGHYTGTVVFAEPSIVADAGAIALTEASGSVYKIPALAVTDAITFTGIEQEKEAVITLMGSGGAAPATLSSSLVANGVLLKDGVDWVALDGAVINLQVFDAGANKYLIELSRS